MHLCLLLVCESGAPLDLSPFIPQMLPAKLQYLCQEMSPLSNSMESLFRLIHRAVRIAHNATLPDNVAELCLESALESFLLSGR